MKTTPVRHRHVCAQCQTQRVTFSVRGDRRFRARNDHDLCARCYRDHQSMFRRWCRENVLDGWIV
jgi:hypothetical protein